MKQNPLKSIGILGGMSSAATGEYYQLINKKVKAIKGGHTIAELIIYSVNFADIERFVRGGHWEEASVYLSEKAKKLEEAGATCIFLATNTMHKVRSEIKAATTIPFVDIFETVSKEIKAQGKTKIGMLGTYPVMSDPFFRDAYNTCGVELMLPTETEKREIDRIIFDELTQHRFEPSSAAYYIQVIRNLSEQGAEGIILGCTEIKMLITQSDVPNIPLFDTTEVHCEWAAKICTGEIELAEIMG